MFSEAASKFAVVAERQRKAVDRRCNSKTHLGGDEVVLGIESFYCELAMTPLKVDVGVFADQSEL